MKRWISDLIGLTLLIGLIIAIGWYSRHDSAATSPEQVSRDREIQQIHQRLQELDQQEEALKKQYPFLRDSDDDR